MSTVITADAETITPILVDGYESTRDPSNIVHPILGGSSPDVTLRPAQMRTGTLTLLFDDEDDSKSAEDVLAVAGVCQVVSTERATVEMTFVVSGNLSRTLEDSTRELWLVAVGFQEVAP